MNNKFSNPISSRLAVIVVAALMTWASTACESEPETQPDDREDQQRQVEPEETEEASKQGTDDVTGQDDDSARALLEQLDDEAVAISVGSLREVLDAPDSLLETERVSDDVLDEWGGNWTMLRQVAQGGLGADPFDPETLRSWGIDPDGLAFFGSIGFDPVFCTELADGDDFEQFAVEILAGDLRGIDDPEADQQQIEERTIHTVDQQVAWAYVDDSVCFTSKEVDDDPDSLGTGDRDTAPEIISMFVSEAEDGEALTDTAGYDYYQNSDLSDGMLTAYTENGEHFAELIRPAVSFRMRRAAEDLFTAHAISADVADDVFAFRFWGGLENQPLDLTRSVTSADHHFDWSRFVTDETTAAVRLSIQPEQLWQQVGALLGTQIEAAADQMFDQNLEATIDEPDTDHDVDPEEHLIGNLSGQLGLFIYDVVNPESLSGDTPPDPGEDLEAVIAAHFVDESALAESFDALYAVLAADESVSVQRRTTGEDDGIEILELDEDVDRIYRKDDVVVVATGATAESKVLALLDGQRADDELSNGRMNAALTRDEFTGLYLGEASWEALEHLVEVPGISEHYREAMVEVSTTEDGVDIELDISPAGSAFFGVASSIQQFDQSGEQVETVTPEEPVHPSETGE